MIDTVKYEPEFIDLNCQPRVFSTTNNGHTTILFSLNKIAPVNIKIYNVAGRLISNLTAHQNQSLSLGENAITWDGRNDSDKKCVSGLYIVCALVNGRKEIKTIAIVN